jgi:hypothetical protein
MPHMGFGGASIHTQLDRTDIVMMESVEGASSSLVILFGLIEIVDDEHWKIIGIPIGFTEKYSFADPQGLPFGFVGPYNRAYYKALEQAQEADAVFTKSVDHEDFGIPLLWGTKRITVRGRAMRFNESQ